jgi:hypothetical protein
MELPYGLHALVLGPAIASVALMPGEPRRTAPRADASADAASGLPPGFGTVAIVAPWVFIFASVSAAVLPPLVRANLGGFVVAFGGLVPAMTLMMAVVVQPFLRRWSSRRSAILGLSVGSAGLLCGAAAASSGSPIGVLAAAVLLGGGYGGCLISGLRFVEMRTTPSTRGRLTGIYYVITYIGFASPLAVAQLAKHTGDIASIHAVLGLALITLFTVAVGRD